MKKSKLLFFFSLSLSLLPESEEDGRRRGETTYLFSLSLSLFTTAIPIALLSSSGFFSLLINLDPFVDSSRIRTETFSRVDQLIEAESIAGTHLYYCSPLP